MQAGRAARPPLKSAWAQIVRGGSPPEPSNAQVGAKASPADARRAAAAAEPQHTFRADYAKPAAVRVQAAVREEAMGQGTGSNAQSGAASAASPKGVVPASSAPSPGTTPSEPCSTEKDREGASAECSGDAQVSTPKHEVSSTSHPVPCRKRLLHTATAVVLRLCHRAGR